MLLNMGINLVLLGFAICSIVQKSYLPQDNSTWKIFENSLEEGEVIIDAVIVEKIAYTIISSELTTDYGDRFAVFIKEEDQNWRREYTNDFKDLKPWKLELGDVDGDGTGEILIAVRKTTHFEEEEKNRMFLFNYDGKKLIKKWTGSQTPEEWNDFMIGDLLPIKGEELIFTELVENGVERLGIYYWFDFGFVRLAESENYKDILSLSIIEQNQLQMIHLKVWERMTTLTVQGGKIIKDNNE